MIMIINDGNMPVRMMYASCLYKNLDKQRFSYFSLHSRIFVYVYLPARLAEAI